MSEVIIRHKAKEMYDLICTEAKRSGQFTASASWFWRFKQRTGVKSVRKVGESALVDRKEVAKFVKAFAREIKRGGYTPDQIFNVDETGLFWKKNGPARRTLQKHSQA